ncbi:hypothetical protein C0992_002236 [Termitomyces sp. T32_za158]|nr:hypothetical protein C0992_002236 [Termitomyces sp. T32_za158]
MDDSSASGAHVNDLGSSVASILGIKGGLRFRAHGSTQKAHIVLRRVTASDGSRDDSLSGKVVRFTFIAHKRIEVRPGKELLLMLESENGPFKDQPVIMEGDLKSSGDTSGEEDDPQDTDKEESFIPPVKEAIPPKMRRAWAKVDDITLVTPPAKKSPAVLTSVGVQTELSHVSISTQTQWFCKDKSSQTSSSSTSVSVQSDDVDTANETERAPVGLDSKGTNGGQSPNLLIVEKKERSLSPMDLDSPSDSPQLSPTPTSCLPNVPPLSVLSPTYSPTLSIASSSGAQDMQLSPIDVKPTLYIQSLTNGVVVDDTKVVASSPHQKPFAKALVAHSPSTADIAAGPLGRSIQPPVNNPFVSGGFVTEFGAPPEERSKSSQGREEFKSPTPSEPESVLQSHLVPSPSVDVTVARRSYVAQNAIASSSKFLPSKVPTQPKIHTRILSGRALEKSPVRDLYESPPPELKPLAYIPSGPTLNPLGIRPSTVAALNNSSRNSPRVPPNAPKKLSTPVSVPVKKRLVVGSEWRPFVKVTNSNVPAPRSVPVTPHVPPPSIAAMITSSMPPHLAPCSSPSSPPAALPPLPPPSAPENDCKRVSATISSSSATTSVPTTPCPLPKSDVNDYEKDSRASSRIHGLPSEIAQTTSLKDRLALSSASSNTSTPSTPVTSNSRDLRNRVSITPALSLQTTTSTSTPASHSILTSPTSTLVSQSPGDGQVGVRNIAFSSDGSHFALSCNDRTIRVWNSRTRLEIANLSHNSPVLAVAWMEGDAGVVSLGEDGIVSKWTRTQGLNHWQWAKVLDAGKNDGKGDDDKICLAYFRERIAVSYPRIGVKVWIWSKGTWQAQRSILRPNVTALIFVDEGAAIIGGTRDGVVWYSEVPNGTLRAYAFLSTRIYTLSLAPSGTHVLVGLGSKAYVIAIRQPGKQGDIERSFSCKELEDQGSQASLLLNGFGAVFATEGQAVLFGSVEGCVLVWDRKKAVIVYGLEHEEDDTIQAVASFDGPTNREGYLLTGTKSGKLSWWAQPVAS